MAESQTIFIDLKTHQFDLALFFKSSNYQIFRKMAESQAIFIILKTHQFDLARFFVKNVSEPLQFDEKNSLSKIAPNL